MRIRNRFILALMLPGFALLAGTMLLLSTNTCFKNLRNHIQYFTNLRSANFVLANLTQEFLLYRSPMVSLQILTAHRQMGEQLASHPAHDGLMKLAVGSDHLLLSSIKDDHQRLGVFLTMLLEERDQPGSTLAGTLLLKFQDIDHKIAQIENDLGKGNTSVQWRSNLALIGAGTFILVILVLCLLPLYRRLCTGLDIITDGAQRIATGDFNHRILATGTNELDLLAQEFNGMNVRLQESFDSFAQILNEQKIILNNVGFGVALLKERKIVWVNPAIKRIFGIAADENLTGKSSAVLYPDQESFLRFGEATYPVLDGGATYIAEGGMLRKDGTPILCRLLGQTISPRPLEVGVI